MQNLARAPSIVVAGNATITVASPRFKHSFANALKRKVITLLRLQLKPADHAINANKS